MGRALVGLPHRDVRRARGESAGDDELGAARAPRRAGAGRGIGTSRHYVAHRSPGRRRRLFGRHGQRCLLRDRDAALPALPGLLSSLGAGALRGGRRGAASATPVASDCGRPRRDRAIMSLLIAFTVFNLTVDLWYVRRAHELESLVGRHCLADLWAVYAE